MFRGAAVDALRAPLCEPHASRWRGMTPRVLRVASWWRSGQTCPSDKP